VTVPFLKRAWQLIQFHGIAQPTLSAQALFRDGHMAASSTPIPEFTGLYRCMIERHLNPYLTHTATQAAQHVHVVYACAYLIIAQTVLSTKV